MKYIEMCSKWLNVYAFTTLYKLYYYLDIYKLFSTNLFYYKNFLENNKKIWSKSSSNISSRNSTEIIVQSSGTISEHNVQIEPL